MRPLFRLLSGLAVMACIAPASHAGIISASYIVGAASVSGDELSIPISLEFDADAGEVVTFFSIGVDGSDPLLTNSGMNYLRFSFDLESPALDDFNLVINFGSTEFDNFAEYDTIAVGLVPGVQLLGELKVDFAGSGLTPDASKVSIASADTLIGYEGPSTIFDFYAPDIRSSNNGGGGGGGNMIPEPATVLIPLIGLMSGTCIRRRRRSVLHR